MSLNITENLKYEELKKYEKFFWYLVEEYEKIGDYDKAVKYLQLIP